jgi:hypothetical protein
MNEIRLTGLDATDPLGFMAAAGVLRVVARNDMHARLSWLDTESLSAVLHTTELLDLLAVIWVDLNRWRIAHAAVDFAVGADRKVQDLKHEPGEFRELMARLATEPEAAEFVASYATGIAVDGTGQTKPTSLHFSAGQQRFMDAVLDLRTQVTEADLLEALFGPWRGRSGTKDTRWRAASERSRALLSFDPGKEAPTSVPGAAWLAFQAMPLFPVVPVGRRIVTTGVTGRGKREQFTWPVWSGALTVSEVRLLIGTKGLAEMRPRERASRGIKRVLQADINRNPQGYGNFAAAHPV